MCCGASISNSNNRIIINNFHPYKKAEKNWTKTRIEDSQDVAGQQEFAVAAYMQLLSCDYNFYCNTG